MIKKLYSAKSAKDDPNNDDSYFKDLEDKDNGNGT